MKVSLNTAKYHSNVDLLPQGGVDELVQKIGAQLGAVETVDHSGLRFDGVVVAKVVRCEKHPNADKLSVCLIDDGGAVKDVERKDRLVEVVCGAPNVAAGQNVAWIPPGATVPSTHGSEDPFILTPKELRGIVSNGMIASAAELGLSDDHSGIVVIDPAEVGEELTKPGTPFKKLYGLDDIIVEIENKMFTHRPDCFGILGVSREIAGIQGLAFQSPKWYQERPKFQDSNFKDQLPLNLDNRLPDIVPRFMAVALSNVQIQPSPIWLQALLTRVGIKPINNVVDITNYIGYLTGQPMHAYDYDKVKALSSNEPTLVIRYPKEGESVALLNGKTLQPRNEAIMIATDRELVGLGGIMGGTSTEVDGDTKNIILECANFDMYNIRRSSMEHGIFTEAATRFTKGQSVGQNDLVLAHAMTLLSEVSGAEQASPVLDPDFEKAHSHLTGIDIGMEFISQRLGLDLSISSIAKLLTNVEFGIEQVASNLVVSAPFWRTDIEIKEDIVEEVGRLLGFDKLPLELPKRVVIPTKLDQKLSTKKKLRLRLAGYGANEVLTYSFVHGNLIKRSTQDVDQAFRLSNALSPDLQYYRLSLTPSLLAHVHQNIKAGHDEFAMFEIGKCHNKTLLDEDKVPMEFDRVALTLASKSNKRPAYFQAQKYVNELLGTGFKLAKFDSKLYDDHAHINQMAAPFEPGRNALVVAPKGYVVGIVGEYKTDVMRAFKLPAYSAGFEVFLSAFSGEIRQDYVPLSRYPGTSGDITLEVDDKNIYALVVEKFSTALNKNLATDQYVDFELRDIYSSEKIPGKKRYTFHVTLTSYSHTLTDAVVSKCLDQVSAELKSSIDAIRI